MVWERVPVLVAAVESSWLVEGLVARVGDLDLQLLMTSTPTCWRADGIFTRVLKLSLLCVDICSVRHSSIVHVKY